MNRAIVGASGCLAAVCLTVGLMAGLVVAPAVAQTPGPSSSPGRIDIVSAEPFASLEVRYQVKVTEPNGANPNTGTVDITGMGPDDSVLVKQSLTPTGSNGRYEGYVTFPDDGAWSIEFRSTVSGASTSLQQEITGSTASSNSPAPGTSEDRASENEASPVVLIIVASTVGGLLLVGLVVVAVTKKPDDDPVRRGG